MSDPHTCSLLAEMMSKTADRIAKIIYWDSGSDKMAKARAHAEHRLRGSLSISPEQTQITTGHLQQAERTAKCKCKSVLVAGLSSQRRLQRSSRSLTAELRQTGSKLGRRLYLCSISLSFGEDSRLKTQEPGGPGPAMLTTVTVYRIMLDIPCNY
nr:hypothetical protein CFP56_33794 [Quercus suber]